MIHFFEVIYYYCYRFYAQKFWHDPTPHITAFLVLGSAVSFFMYTLINICIAYIWHTHLSKGVSIGIGVAIVYGVYLLIFKVGDGLNIIQKKPTLFKNNSISIIITLLFFCLCFSSMFWGSIVTKDIITNGR